MKNVLKILLAIVVSSYVGCSSEKDENTENLIIDMGKANGILIPAPATTFSCEQLSKQDTAAGSVGGAYFTLPNPKISWTLSENPQLSEVRVVVLKLSLNSPKIGGEYSCIFSDLALGAMYFKRVPVSESIVAIHYWDALLGRGAASGNATTTLTVDQGYTACPLKCGGLTIPPNSGQFSVTGTWEVLAVRKKYASETSTDYEETPIKVQGEFTVTNGLN